jgi:hypothetical protein
MGLSLTRVAAGAALAFSCLTISLVPSVAHADESAAETFFQEGINAMKRNDYTVACDAFGKSNRADPSPGTQINLALCFEKQKKWASAWTWYRSAFGLAQQRGQKEREQLADESATRIRPQIHYIVVSVKEPLTDMVVRRDGNEVATVLGGKEIPLPVDPGEHTLEVSAKSKKPWTHTFTAADSPSTDKIDVPKLENDDKPAAGGPGGEGSSLTVSSGGSGQKITGIIIGGVGLLSAVGSVVSFFLAKDQEGKRDKVYADFAVASAEQKPELERSAKSYHDAAKADELIAFSLLGAAGVLVGVGALLYFTAPKAKATATYVLPMLSPTLAGLGLGGTF